MPATFRSWRIHHCSPLIFSGPTSARCRSTAGSDFRCAFGLNHLLASHQPIENRSAITAHHWTILELTVTRERTMAAGNRGFIAIAPSLRIEQPAHPRPGRLRNRRAAADIKRRLDLAGKWDASAPVAVPSQSSNVTILRGLTPRVWDGDQQATGIFSPAACGGPRRQASRPPGRLGATAWLRIG
jgi:hypothetical protein